MDTFRKLGLSIAAGVLVATLATPASAERIWARVPYGGGTVVVQIEVDPAILAAQSNIPISSYYQWTPTSPNLGLGHTGFTGATFNGFTFRGPSVPGGRFTGVPVPGGRFTGVSWHGVWNAGPPPY
jgi:hypothetical protein